MQILNNKHKRKSAVITALLLLLFIFAIFNFGMQYLDPPEEYGVAINFGDAEVGSGSPVLTSKQSILEEVVKTAALSKTVKETPKETLLEEVITKETAEEVPVVEKVRDKKPAPVKEVVEKELHKPIPKPKPSKENRDALNKLLNGSTTDGAIKGEGDTNTDGLKGEKDGDPISSKYYGNTGTGSGGNYNLAGRKALSTPKKQPDCQEEGIVVVRITVDRNGKVVRAIPGVKGTTNTAPCLSKPAKEAALSTVWNSDGDAPKIQTGTIIYKFSLSK
jgi:protein TonB